MRVTWLFYHFLKLQVHILHSLENISIFIIWKLWLVRCDVIFSGTSLILPKMSENFWSKEIPLWWFTDSTLKLDNSITAWPIPVMHISFSSILNALSYEVNLSLRCSSPLRSNLERRSKLEAYSYIYSSKTNFLYYFLQTRKLGLRFWSFFSETSVKNRNSLATA